jgi:hypothetical protein
MPRRKLPTSEQIREFRSILHEDVERGGLPVAETVRRMREAMGLTQQRFGEVFKPFAERGRSRVSPADLRRNALLCPRHARPWRDTPIHRARCRAAR